MTIYLNIGSNQGDRRALIEHAIALIAGRFAAARLRRSAYIESEPWGYESANRYLNIGVSLTFDAPLLMPTPLDVLDATQHIERQVDASPHRNADGSYCDRGIDIDIIAIDNLAISTPRLALPHPRALQRHFVMLPMLQLSEE